MSDQTQRSFFPNGFPLSLLGEALFDSRLDLDTYAERYFTAAYGQDAAKCREYLAGISRLFDPPSLRDDSQDVVQQDTGTGEKAAPQRSWTNNAEAAERFARVPCHVDAFLPVIRKNLEHSRGSRAKSWKLLLHHAEYCARLSRILGSGARGDMTAARAQFGELIDWLSRIEDEIQPDFDLVLFHQVMSRKLREIPRPAAGAAGT